MIGVLFTELLKYFRGPLTEVKDQGLCRPEASAPGLNFLRYLLYFRSRISVI